MKEAAGEANLTVIAIVLIGVVAAVVTPLVNSYLRNASQKSCCTNYGGSWQSGKCVDSAGKTITDTTYWDASKNSCK